MAADNVKTAFWKNSFVKTTYGSTTNNKSVKKYQPQQQEQNIIWCFEIYTGKDLC